MRRVCRLEGTEEKLRNRESRPEDLHIIAELREMVTEREALVKKLVVSTHTFFHLIHNVLAFLTIFFKLFFQSDSCCCPVMDHFTAVILYYSEFLQILKKS